MPQGILFHHDLSNVKNRDEHIAPTLLTGEPHSIAVQGQPLRNLSPIECERLMGFPDDYTDIPCNGRPAPKTARYKVLGNAWAINCARWILRRLNRKLHPPCCPPAIPLHPFRKTRPPDHLRGPLSQKHFTSSHARFQNTLTPAFAGSFLRFRKAVG